MKKKAVKKKAVKKKAVKKKAVKKKAVKKKAVKKKAVKKKAVKKKAVKKKAVKKKAVKKKVDTSIVLSQLGITPNARLHVSGRYVDGNGNPAYLVTTLSESAVTATVFAWGFWPMAGYEAQFSETESLVWVKGTNVTHYFALEDMNLVSHFGESKRVELDFIDFPYDAESAASILGAMLNLEVFDSSRHEFGEEIVDDGALFERQWKKIASLRPVSFIEKSFKIPGNGIQIGPNPVGDLTVFEVPYFSYKHHCEGFSLQKTNDNSSEFIEHEGSSFIGSGGFAVAHVVNYEFGDVDEFSCISCVLKSGAITTTDSSFVLNKLLTPKTSV